MPFDVVFSCSIGMPGSVHGGRGGGRCSYERGSGQRVDEGGSRLCKYYFFKLLIIPIVICLVYFTAQSCIIYWERNREKKSKFI
jgi:hypothetical protein